MGLIPLKHNQDNGIDNYWAINAMEVKFIANNRPQLPYNTQPQLQTPTVTYKTVYRATPSSPSPSSSTATPNPPITSGYGGNFSQSQYEAFMRRSGMLDTANAESTSSIEFMVECSLLT